MRCSHSNKGHSFTHSLVPPPTTVSRTSLLQLSPLPPASCCTVFTVQRVHSQQHSHIVGIYSSSLLNISGLLHKRILKELCQFNSSTKSFLILSSTCSSTVSLPITILTLTLSTNQSLQHFQTQWLYSHPHLTQLPRLFSIGKYSILPETLSSLGFWNITLQCFHSTTLATFLVFFEDFFPCPNL